MPNEDLSKLSIRKTDKVIRPAKRRRLIYWAAVVVAVIVVAWAYRAGMLRPAITVELATVSLVYPSQTLSQLNASGYVVAQRKAAVASKVTGRLVSLMVEEGSRVKEGQVIARLENEDAVAAKNQSEANVKAAMANLELAKADLEEATRNFERSKQLFGGRTISKAEYDVAEARYLKGRAAVAAAAANVTASSAAVEAAQVALDYTSIRAPFDAVVLTKNADIGDIVTPLGAAANAKAAVVTIADMDSLQVEADVSETNLSLVSVGQPCDIQLDALSDTRLQGVVHAVVPTADRSKATVMIKVRFLTKDARVLPEMRAKVAFLSRPLKPDERKPFTSIQRNALITQGDRSAAFVVRGDRVVKVAVSTGASFGDLVEVLEGVKAGDRIVIKPSPGLKDESRIKSAER
jgi:RND family efflux transporter MFP subunit